MLRLGEWRYLREVYSRTRKEMKANGLALIRDELVAEGFTSALDSLGPWTDDKINDAWKKAEAAGELSDEIVLDYAKSDKTGLGDGSGFLDFFKKIIDWISDPANQEKLMAVIKFLMLIISMFGA